jgi:hypothetical protein
MNCYEFEQNISAFIEDEIKREQKEKIINHKGECLECATKIDKVSKMINSLHSLDTVQTSSVFESVLKDKISNIENKKDGLWYNLFNLKPFGLEPIPAMGLSLAFLMILGSSYILINQDKVPDIKLNNIISNKTIFQNSPSISEPVQELPEIADQDTLINSKKNKVNNSIRLVGGK